MVVVGDIAIIVTSSRLQVTLRVETCVELELSLPESDLELSLLIMVPEPKQEWLMENVLSVQQQL